MADDEWVPPRWYLKNVPKHVKDQMFGRSQKPTTNKPPVQRRKLFVPVVGAEPQILQTDDIAEKLKADSRAAQALLSEFGLEATAARKSEK